MPYRNGRALSTHIHAVSDTKSKCQTDGWTKNNKGGVQQGVSEGGLGVIGSVTALSGTHTVVVGNGITRGSRGALVGAAGVARLHTSGSLSYTDVASLAVVDILAGFSLALGTRCGAHGLFAVLGDEVAAFAILTHVSVVHDVAVVGLGAQHDCAVGGAIDAYTVFGAGIVGLTVAEGHALGSGTVTRAKTC